MYAPAPLEKLESAINDYSPVVRASALAELEAWANRGSVQLGPEMNIANLHCHTFFSFNAYGYSPSGLAWLAKRWGIKLLGIVDFDVLDGVDEFLTACERIGVRGSAGMETRVYLPEFTDKEINSPGEPGVFYTMGIGFSSSQAPASVAPILSELRHRAEERNRDMVQRINAVLAPAVIDYDRDVLPLTPLGNATERHILVAYTRIVDSLFSDSAPFWAERLGLPIEQVRLQMIDHPKFQNTVRAKLMKLGGVGYIQPGAETFPTIEVVNRLVTACGALPCATWLDGLSAGEQVFKELLSMLIDKGVVALNIIPDRNWNIPDPALRWLKLKKLYEVVQLAQEFDLPLNVGTEMNAYGLKLVDDFDAVELLPVRKAFMDGAHFVYGHTMMQRTLGLGYQSEWAQAQLPTRRDRNTFYTQIGRLTPPGAAGLAHLRRLSAEAAPAEFLRSFGFVASAGE